MQERCVGDGAVCVCGGKGCVYKKGVFKRGCVGRPRCVCVRGVCGDARVCVREGCVREGYVCEEGGVSVREGCVCEEGVCV